jgi:rubrerythrin
MALPDRREDAEVLLKSDAQKSSDANMISPSKVAKTCGREASAKTAELPSNSIPSQGPPAIFPVLSTQGPRSETEAKPGSKHPFQDSELDMFRLDPLEEEPYRAMDVVTNEDEQVISKKKRPKTELDENEDHDNDDDIFRDKSAADEENKDQPGTAVEMDLSVKNLALRFPDLAAEYDTTNKVPVNDVLISSGAIASWKCRECGHRWDSAVFVRGVLRTKCPACESAKNPKVGETAPLLVREWDGESNDPFLDVKSLPISSTALASWVCSVCRTPFESRVKDRVSGKTKCPQCVLVGMRMGFKGHERLEAEWHPVKNGDLKLDALTIHDKRKVWWLCSHCGHEWETKISSRQGSGRGKQCPSCGK